MAFNLRSTVRRIVPEALLNTMRDRRRRRELETIKTLQGIIDHAPEGQQWLDQRTLEKLCATSTFPGAYGYDDNAVEARGIERAEFLQKKLNGRPAKTFLDLACFDGMTAAALQRQGKLCWGVDLTEIGFDKRARQVGVQFAAVDAGNMAFDDATFDVVYSFNAFEHFSDPEKVLREALRVTRPDGQVILRFGPLYASSKGLHAYDRIPVPYCQFLFPLEMMNDFLRNKSLEEIDPAHCNGWTVQQFRELWKGVSDVAMIRSNEEFMWLNDVEIIQRYPSCFKGKVKTAEDLAVNIIEVVFVKR